MKDAIPIDKNYKKPFYPRDTFEGLGITRDDAFVEIAKYILTNKQHSSKVGACGDFVQQTIFDQDHKFVAAAVSKADERGKQLDLHTCFAISFFWSETTYPVEVTGIHLTMAGEVIVKGNIFDAAHPDKRVHIELQDIDFFSIGRPYKIGGIYNFRIGGIAHTFMKRPKENLYIKVDKGPLAGKEISTVEMDGMTSKEDVAACAIIMQPFSGFHEPPFRTPFSEHDVQIYDYHWRNGLVSLNFPISVGENILKEQKMSLGEPVDMSVILQGFSI